MEVWSPEVLHPDTQTDGWLLTAVASRLHPNPHKLRHFANLLGMDDDTYCAIQQNAEVTGQGLPLNVSSRLVVPGKVIGGSLRVTFLVGFSLLLQNFGKVAGIYECNLPFCECGWSGWDIHRWWNTLTLHTIRVV